MKIILETVVGSRLHGLNNEYSDWDIRGIFMHPLRDILTPFRKVKNTSWIEGDEDNTAYELRDFLHLCTKGNPTILEVLWSNMVRTETDLSTHIRHNRHKLLDSRAIYEAHKGYAHNQYNKMNLFEPDARTPKFAVAYIRTLQQGIQLLSTGEYEPQITRNKEFLLDVKYNWNESHIGTLSKLFAELQVEFADVYAREHNKYKPDIEWIEDFIYKAYTGYT